MISWLKNFFTEKSEGLVPISSNIKFDVEEKMKMKEQEELEWIYIGDGMMEQVRRRKEFNAQTPSRSVSSSQASSNDYALSAMIYNSTSNSDSSSYDSGSCDSSSSSSCD